MDHQAVTAMKQELVQRNADVAKLCSDWSQRYADANRKVDQLEQDKQAWHEERARLNAEITQSRARNLDLNDTVNAQATSIGQVAENVITKSLSGITAIGATLSAEKSVLEAKNRDQLAQIQSLQAQLATNQQTVTEELKRSNQLADTVTRLTAELHQASRIKREFHDYTKAHPNY
jgi:uncharacterized coiled-coil DUF342 family protein